VCCTLCIGQTIYTTNVLLGSSNFFFSFLSPNLEIHASPSKIDSPDYILLILVLILFIAICFIFIVFWSFFKFISRKFISSIQFGPYSFDCSFLMFYPFLDSFIFQFWSSSFYFILFFYPILIIIMLIVAFLPLSWFLFQFCSSSFYFFIQFWFLFFWKIFYFSI